MIRRRTAVALAASVVALGIASKPASAQSDAQDQRIQQLEAKIAALEARQAADSREVAATIDKVLRDAERRSQLLAAGGDTSAGYDNGFFIRSGANLLRVGAQFQFRGVASYREDTGGDKNDEIENGFEVRRMKLELGGTLLSKDLEYFFQWATEREGGDVYLEEAWAKYMFADEWGVKAGHFKDPVHHEELVSSKRQMAVERSLLNELLGGGFTDRVQGVSLIYGNYGKNAPVYAELALHDGLNSDNTNFTGRPEPLPDDPLGLGSSHSLDWGVSGRLEVKVMGDWKNYRDFSAMGTREDLLVIGGGFDWSQGGDGDIFCGTLDVQYEHPQGLGLYGAGLVRTVDGELVGSDDTFTDWGLLAQVSYMFNPAWEAFLRYDVTIYDEDVVFSNGNSEDTFHEVTIGINYYLGKDGSAGHRAKLTFDLTWLPNGAPKSVSGNGIMDKNNGENEWIFRGQFQLLI